MEGLKLILIVDYKMGNLPNVKRAVELFTKDVIISLGKDNDYKHPHEEVLKRYKSLNLNIYRTDLNGTVTINTNGTTYEILKEQ